jgi:hypothetical protein
MTRTPPQTDDLAPTIASQMSTGKRLGEWLGMEHSQA